MNNKKLAQTTIVVTIILLLSKVSGFLRDVAMAYAYGTSEKSDAFVLSMSAVGVFAMVFNCISIAYMPIYKMLSVEGKLARRKKFVDTVYSVLGVTSIVMAVIGVICADWVVYILAPGFTESGHMAAVSVTRIMMCSLPLSFLVNISSQQLRGENFFLTPSAIGIPSNFVLIFSFLVISPIFDIQGVAWGNVFGIFLQVVILFLLLYRMGYRYGFRFDLKEEGLRSICVLMFPILLGNAIQTINTIVDRILASGLAEGSMAALNFSNRLSLFIISLISLGAGNVCYTKMAELGANKNYAELTTFLRSIINLLNIIVVPATVGMMVLSAPIIKTVFEYGAFGSSSSELTATALYFYAMGLVGYSLRDIITRAFYSLQDSKTPMINGAFAVVLNVVLNILFVRVMGIGGLALATSISAILGTVLLLFSLRRKLGRIGGHELCSTFLKTCGAAGIMGVCVHFGYSWIYGMVGVVPIALMLDICIGVVLYGLLLLFMKIKEVDFVILWVRRILCREKKIY